jgi:hypothetical protein
MRRITATALCLSLGIGGAGLSGPAVAAKRADAGAHAALVHQRHAAEAQRRAGHHVFAGHHGWNGGRLSAARACAMFFGRC